MSFGLIGSNTLGSSLALNVSKNNKLHLFDTKNKKFHKLINNNGNMPFIGHDNMDTMIEEMEQPRTIMSVLESGADSTNTIYELSKMLNENDTVLDFTNEHYSNSLKKDILCRKNGVGYLGIGMTRGSSKSEPSMMIGGDIGTFEHHIDFLKKISPNVVHVTENAGSGHFTKMVHDGIEQAMLQCLSDVFTYCNYSQSEFECMIYYAMQFSAKGDLLRNALNASREFNLCKDALPDIQKSPVWCTEISIEKGLFTPVINAAVLSGINSKHTYNTSFCNLKSIPVKEEIVTGTILFVYSCVLLEGCDLLRTYRIPTNRGKLAWKRGSNIECEMLHFQNGELEKIRSQNAGHARKLLLGCVSQERSVPVVSAAVDSFDYQRCSGVFMSIHRR